MIVSTGGAFGGILDLGTPLPTQWMCKSVGLSHFNSPGCTLKSLGFRTSPMAKNRPIEIFGDAFWADFHAKFWEKKPLLLKGGASRLLEVDAAHVFELLVQYSDHCRKSGTTEGLKLYIDGQLQYAEDALRLLPLRKDQALAGYHSRMSREFSDYCLVCDELLQVSQAKWDLLGTFMQGLYRHVGIPTRYAEIGLYLGNYRRTPFGVHVDGCGVLSIPVVGKKKFRLWAPEFAEKHPGLQDAFTYETYKKKSQVLVAKPGDITYWPSTYWHIAESDGSFSATWSLGVWMDRPFSEALFETIQPLLERKLGPDADARSIPFRKFHGKDGRIERLPDILDRSVKLLAGLSKGELHDTLLRYWLEVASKRGFKNAPVPGKRTRLQVGDRVRGKPQNPILWASLAGGGACVAANGTLVDISDSRNIKMIEALNSGGTCEVNRSSLGILQALQGAHGICLIDP